jgi:hypothetical protein
MNSTAAVLPNNITKPNKIGAYLIIIGALGALLVTLWRYLTPLSGVNGSGGAEITMLGEAALILAGLILLRNDHDFIRKLFLFLSCIGVLLTIVATVFLHGWISTVLLIVCAIGVLIEIFTRAKSKRV